MEPTPQTSIGDRSPAHPLEISVALASSVEQVLFRFAEKAELETALVVDHGGALVSGISADEGQDVDVISALAAGASGAIQALVKKLGDSSEVESFHHGSGQVVYLAGVGGRFVLVGVCRGATSIGAIREEARQVRPSLASLLATLDATQTAAQERPPVERTPERPQVPPHHAGQAVPEAQLAPGGPTAVEAPEIPCLPAEVSARPEDSGELEGPGWGEGFPALTPPPAGNPEAWEHSEPEPREEAGLEGEAESGTVAEASGEAEPGSELDSLPTGIVEYLGEESPEVVIEPSMAALGNLSDSPFEVEEEDAGALSGSGGNDEAAEEAAGKLGAESSPVADTVPAGSSFEFVIGEEFEIEGESVGESVGEDTTAAGFLPVEGGLTAAPVEGIGLELEEEAEAVVVEGGLTEGTGGGQALVPSPAAVEGGDFPPPLASVKSGARRKIPKSAPEPPRSLFEIGADEDLAFEGEPPALGSSGLLEPGSFDLSAFELDFDESEAPPPLSPSGEKANKEGSATQGIAGGPIGADDLFEDPFGDENPFEGADDTRSFGFEPDPTSRPDPAGEGSELEAWESDVRGEVSDGGASEPPPFDPSGDSTTLEDEEGMEEEDERGVSAKGPFYF